MKEKAIISILIASFFVFLIFIILNNCSKKSIEKLTLTNAADTSLCKTKCDEDDRCDFFTYNSSRKECYLSTLKGNTNYMSGYLTNPLTVKGSVVPTDTTMSVTDASSPTQKTAWVMFDNKGIEGYDIGGIISLNAKIGDPTNQKLECARKCRDTNRCTSFTVNKSDAACYLRVGDGDSDTTISSGFKQKPTSEIIYSKKENDPAPRTASYSVIPGSYQAGYAY